MRSLRNRDANSWEDTFPPVLGMNGSKRKFPLLQAQQVVSEVHVKVHDFTCYVFS